MGNVIILVVSLVNFVLFVCVLRFRTCVFVKEVRTVERRRGTDGPPLHQE